MKKAADYRRHADECRALAAQMDREDQREQLLRMAAQWDQLADDRGRLVGLEEPRAASRPRDATRGSKRIDVIA